MQVEVPGYVTSMVFLRLYPWILARGGWQLLMRVMLKMMAIQTAEHKQNKR